MIDEQECPHEAWEHVGGGRKCADCRDWLGTAADPPRNVCRACSEPLDEEHAEPPRCELNVAHAMLDRVFRARDEARDKLAEAEHTIDGLRETVRLYNEDMRALREKVRELDMCSKDPTMMWERDDALEELAKAERTIAELHKHIQSAEAFGDELDPDDLKGIIDRHRARQEGRDDE